MSDTEATWYSDVYGIVFHPREPRVLLVSGDYGWSLPHARMDERLWPRQVTSPCALLKVAIGMPLSIVRCADVRTEEVGEPHVEVIYVLDVSDLHDRLPGRAQWISWHALDALSLSQPRHRAIIGRCVAEEASGVIPPLRPSWQRHGWFHAAAVWIEQQMRQLGRPLVAPVEQVRLQGTTCLLHAQAAGGAVYFKVASALPLFTNEPAVTIGLAGRYPHHVAAPLASDPEQRWMLLDDLGAPLGATPDAVAWVGWLTMFGQMQKHSASCVDELLALGCLDRRLPRLAGQIEPLLNDSTALAGLEADQIERLRAQGPRLVEMCAQLATAAIPPTLVHGDLHPGNIARALGGYRFFDWTDGCIAHPFLDLVTVQDAAEYALGHEAWTSLRESYLALWSDYEALDRLRALWLIAEPLGYLHDAISYQHIVEAMEPTSRWEVDGVVSFLLEKVLGCLIRP